MGDPSGIPSAFTRGPSRPASALQHPALADFLRPPSRAAHATASVLRPVPRVMSPPALLLPPLAALEGLRADTPGLFGDLLRTGTPGMGVFGDLSGRLTPSQLFLSCTPAPGGEAGADDLLNALMHRPESRVDSGIGLGLSLLGAGTEAGAGLVGAAHDALRSLTPSVASGIARGVGAAAGVGVGAGAGVGASAVAGAPSSTQGPRLSPEEAFVRSHPRAVVGRR